VHENPMTFAYADPPYLGQCGKHYGHHHPDGRCWDKLETHQLLIGRLARDYPDGWALSASEPSIRDVLPFTPRGTRVCPWGKSFCAFKRGVRPAHAWEPVFLWGGRNKNYPPPAKGGLQTTPKDFLVAPITLRRGLTGAKPPEFCQWVLELLGYRDGDQIDDLFPGTAIMGKMAAQGRLRLEVPGA
jgi:hypothetical protein